MFTSALGCPTRCSRARAALIAVLSASSEAGASLHRCPSVARLNGGKTCTRADPSNHAAAHRSPWRVARVLTGHAVLQNSHQADDVKLAAEVQQQTLLCGNQSMVGRSGQGRQADPGRHMKIEQPPAGEPLLRDSTQLTAVCRRHNPCQCLARPASSFCMEELVSASIHSHHRCT